MSKEAIENKEEEAKKVLRRCLIKSSSAIHLAIITQFTNLNLDYKEVIEDANQRGMNFDKAALSKYLNTFDEDGIFKGYAKGSLSQENIIWLCVRYGIEIQITTRIKKTINYEETEMKLKKKFGLNGGKSITRRF